ncbi:MAG: hypothetical protein GX072_13745 [Lysinibacillus sp.]|nr:hypothetical protein [Lysinibacillus sp.]
MLTILIIGFLLFFLIAFIIAIPIAAIKAAKTEKQKCPNCENEIRFPKSYGKCPKCRSKIYRHGDGTLRLRT